MTIWQLVNGEEIEQGDLLREIYVPIIKPTFPHGEGGKVIEAVTADVIIVTQSCDLLNNKIGTALVARIMEISEFEQTNTQFKSRRNWNRVRRGEYIALDLIASPTLPEDISQCVVVDFREVYSLPITYLTRNAAEAGDRYRLASPYLEHFSQSFARCFMRVALPVPIAEFR
ncbi:MAG TPA: hypothetical protein VEK82_04165 [Stellaceae bacterium]|nr:hypothetical protein [Stellaceae bacterium]